MRIINEEYGINRYALLYIRFGSDVKNLPVMRETQVQVYLIYL